MNWIDFESMITDGIEPQKGRTIVLYTGISGLDLINYEFKKQNAIDCAEWLHEVKVFTLEQLESLKKMFASPDMENAELAITIIE